MASAIQLPCCGPCGYDDVTKEAGRWCINCQEALCEDCEKAHTRNKKSRNHQVISIEDYRKIEYLSISEVCEHHGKNLDWFCKTHDKVLCMVCVQSNHKQCSDVISINVASKNVRQSATLSDLVESIDGTLNNLQECITNRYSATKKIENQELEIKKMILQTRTKINAHLDKLEEKLLRELGSTSGSCKSENIKILRNLKLAEGKLTKLRQQVLHIKQFSSDIQVFLGTYQGNKSIVSEIKSIKDAIANSKDYELKVNLNSLIGKLKKEVQDFGQIKVTENTAKLDFRDPKIDQAQIGIIFPKSRNISNTQLQLIKTFRISMKDENVDMDITGCVMLSKGNILIANCAEKYLIKYSDAGKHIRDIPVSGMPFGIEVIDSTRIVVTYATANFVEIMNSKTFKVEMNIRYNNDAWGVSQENGRLYVVSGYAAVQVLDLSRKQWETLKIASDSVLNITTTRDRIFYTDYATSNVHCCLINGEEFWQFGSKNILRPRGLAVDNHNNVYVVGFGSNNLTIIQNDGKNSRTLLTESDGLVNPRDVYYDKEKRTLLICNQDGTVLLYKVV
ncbi:unnamed protein product [Mytilus coruscus]|uniref:B box-type domain-containing protein n=1 Tax=Mytilus coruscus TaxID=42192 RepID=A0A6J8D9E1_MYTCO|nr:unnamed protein product [Mytilus coruscus]